MHKSSERIIKCEGWMVCICWRMKKPMHHERGQRVKVEFPNVSGEMKGYSLANEDDGVPKRIIIQLIS